MNADHVQQTVSNVATGTSIGGFAGFLMANEIYLKYGLGVLTAAAAITTILVNWKRLRSKKSD